ncbi:hypothetical protein CKAH01_08309 [Colletotrichum kahawae]|uniref:Uncharacterized protein n=1 Tax=Colletotrichum kahawae TaxID=34407 RepID=A0AAD9Y4N3_COLKA|nr:hypothetical protein CKAH01_08309 [Colletotrichum kahawae]
MTNLNGNTRITTPDFDKQTSQSTCRPKNGKPTGSTQTATHLVRPPLPHPIPPPRNKLPARIPAPPEVSTRQQGPHHLHQHQTSDLSNRHEPNASHTVRTQPKSFRAFGHAKTTTRIINLKKTIQTTCRSHVQDRHAPQTSHLVYASRRRHSTHTHANIHLTKALRDQQPPPDHRVAIILELRKPRGNIAVKPSEQEDLSQV